MSNEMKPGWEQTLMAEDIFKRAVALKLSHMARYLQDEVKQKLFECMADDAMDAAIVFKRRQKERKFPDTMVVGGSTDE